MKKLEVSLRFAGFLKFFYFLVNLVSVYLQFISNLSNFTCTFVIYIFLQLIQLCSGILHEELLYWLFTFLFPVGLEFPAVSPSGSLLPSGTFTAVLPSWWGRLSPMHTYFLGTVARTPAHQSRLLAPWREWRSLISNIPRSQPMLYIV